MNSENQINFYSDTIKRLMVLKPVETEVKTVTADEDITLWFNVDNVSGE